MLGGGRCSRGWRVREGEGKHSDFFVFFLRLSLFVCLSRSLSSSAFLSSCEAELTCFFLILCLSLFVCLSRSLSFSLSSPFSAPTKQTVDKKLLLLLLLTITTIIESYSNRNRQIEK